MARAYFCAYYSYADFLEELTDEEAGRLILAVFRYAKDGEKSDLPPLERMAYRAICSQIDRDNKRYEEICEKNRENIRKRYADKEDGLRPYTNATNDKEKENENENDIDKESDREKVRERETRGFDDADVENFGENPYDAVDKSLAEEEKPLRSKLYRPTEEEIADILALGL